MMALWTGQRQGDLLRLPWSAYDGERITLKQGKTGVRVWIPIGEPLKALLDAAPRKGRTILTTEAGKLWTETGFRASWRTAVKRDGINGVTFHDLRGTAVTRLALAGCSEAEIATITGHSMNDVGKILDAHDLRRDSALARSAIQKREAYEASEGFAISRPTGACYTDSETGKSAVKSIGSGGGTRTPDTRIMIPLL
ncbi:phage integrase [Methylopila sp. Yamaguchi]|nr:phage integrase [Methylopila sp. Yamaguchi]